MRLTSLLICAAIAAGQTVEQGIAEFNRGEYAAAAKTLQGSADSPHARVYLALARAATGGCDLAIAGLTSEFDRAADGDLRRLAGLGLTQCHLGQSRFDAAQATLARLRSQYPSDADVLYLTARLHMRAWNDTVRVMFEKAPSSFRVNQLSAEILELQGKYAEAVAEYRKSIAKNPAALNLHYRLGRALLMESHAPESLSQARVEFEAELRLNPNDAVAEYQIGQILQVQQKSNEAASRFERAVTVSPDFAEALVALGKARLDAGRHADAIPLLEKAVRLQPRNEGARYSLMMAYRNAGRLDEARREKAEIDRLQRPPDGEFTDFLKRLGEKQPKQ